jgi:hypothetical protein
VDEKAGQLGLVIVVVPPPALPIKIPDGGVTVVPAGAAEIVCACSLPKPSIKKKTNNIFDLYFINF